MGLTQEVAHFVARTRYRDIPKEVVQLARGFILDGLGVALAGSTDECSRIVQAQIRQMNGKGESSIVGTALSAPAPKAALANGVAGHAMDYDDTQLSTSKQAVYGLLTHPTTPVLAAVLAIGEKEKISGEAFVLAYLLGVEVECRIADAINPRHYQDGFHSTATMGGIGAAMAVGKILRLNERKLIQTLGIAASMASGLRENFGTMTKPFHAGRAAENGVVAAEIAALGFTASDNGLEADRGFFRAAGGGYSAEMIDGKLGAPWTFAFPGVSIKPHPSGSLTHPGMAVMMDLILRHDLKPERVKRVSVGTNHNMPNALIHHQPRNELQAKFSMEFCMAILLIERKGGLEQFTDDVVNRADVQAMIRKVNFGVHPEAEAAGFDKMTTIIEVELDDGTVVKGQADFGKGSPANPMTDDELAEKFRQCAAWGGLDRDQTKTVLDLVWRIEELSDVGELMTLLRLPERAAHQ